MDFFVENKWFFMVGTEILFWVFTIAFGLIRYLFGRDRLSLVALALLFVNELCLVLLAVLDYRETGEIAAFQIATIAFIIYVLASIGGCFGVTGSLPAHLGLSGCKCVRNARTSTSISS